MDLLIKAVLIVVAVLLVVPLLLSYFARAIAIGWTLGAFHGQMINQERKMSNDYKSKKEGA